MGMSNCPIPKGSENYGNRGTSFKPMLFLALACLAATTATALSLIILHLRRYRVPKEQRQIIRIVFSVIVYSLVAFFELVNYSTAQYIDPLGDVYEAFGLAALFLLFIQFAAPSGTFGEATFAQIRAAEETETRYNWPKISWIFVFQYPIIEVLCVIIQEVTEGTGRYCMNSLSPEFAHLWVELIESISITPCVIAIWKFRTRMKARMKVRRGLSKIVAFKVIVFIRFIQQWAFSALLQYHVIKPSKTFSYDDILYGIPAVATCVEMVLFAAGFWYAYSSTEYGPKAKLQSTPLPTLKAIWDVVNISDLLIGMARVFPLCVDAQRNGDWKEYWSVMRDQGLQGAIRKGVGKYKTRKDRKAGRYQELDEGMESLTKPGQTHHMRSESTFSNLDRDYEMSGGLDASEIYQPPAESPPYETSGQFNVEEMPAGRMRALSQSHLTAEAAPVLGRPRASSQSSLMQETTALTADEELPSYDSRPSPPHAPVELYDKPMEERDGF